MSGHSERRNELNVLIVDDSAVYRRILRQVLSDVGGVTVAGAVGDGRAALAMLARVPVDCVLLDLEMPEMDGLETLSAVKQDYPDIGVVMVSGTNRESADVTIEALGRGALDFIAKPNSPTMEENRQALSRQIGPILLTLSTRRNVSRIRQALSRPPSDHTNKLSSKSVVIAPAIPAAAIAIGRMSSSTEERAGRFEAVAIGVSTGGPEALAEVIPKLPADLKVPVLIVQHMPPLFTASLASSLGRTAALEVVEARQAQVIEVGKVFIAPGGRHMELRRVGDSDGVTTVVRLTDGAPVNSCRPAVDVLFHSVARIYDSVLCVILTGMGSDGCEGVRRIKQMGKGYCLAQDEESSIIYGMPKAVQQAGLADEVLPLANIATRIVQLVGRRC